MKSKKKIFLLNSDCPFMFLKSLTPFCIVFVHDLSQMVSFLEVGGIFRVESRLELMLS